jgi:hypothetical protein
MTAMNRNYVDRNTVIIQQPQQPAYGEAYSGTAGYYGQAVHGQNFSGPVPFEQPAYFPNQQAIIVKNF